MSAQEIELKLTLSEEDIRRLASSPEFTDLTGGIASTRLLRSVYYDTPDAALGREKISLRIRDNGETRVQTAKLDGGLNKGLSQTLEYEDEITTEVPDIGLIKDETARRRIEIALAGQLLVPLFETYINRTAALIDIAGEGTVELALDIGEVRAGDKRAPLSEVELELKSGAPYTMLSAAEKLFAGVVVAPGTLHKARRGFILIGLADAEEEMQATLTSSGKTEITHGMSGVEALRFVGNEATEQILKNWELMLKSPSAEGAHHLRIGLRRLRIALHMLSAKKLGPEFAVLEKRAQGLARIVGELRDADVLLSDIFNSAANHLEGIPEGGAFRDVLNAHIEEKRRLVQDSLQSADWAELKLHCLFFDFLMDRAIARAGSDLKDANVLKYADKALKKAWRRVNKWGKRIDELSPEERHSMRKKLKSLRYVTEFFLPLYSAKTAKPFLKKLQRLQDVFGYLNDVETSRKLFAIVAKSKDTGEDLSAQASLICNWHQGRADVAW